MVKHCLNCGATLSGEYCGACGQRDVDLERPFPSLAREVVEESLQLDGRVARTLTTLVRRPGELTRQYLAGRRQLYTSPLRLYLVISVLFFLVAAGVVGQGALLSESQTIESHASQQAQFLSDQLPQLMFLLLPVFALLLKLTFRARRYFHHLVHSLHLHSAAYLVLALLLPLERAAETNVFLLTVQLALLAYLLAYVVTSLRRVYEQRWITSAGKALVIFLVYAAIIGVVFEGLGQIDPTA
ncbi:MAG: DUF3667 domain-containing protein [Pseudomonadota bacterium]